jgi:hypothetical protein
LGLANTTPSTTLRTRIAEGKLGFKTGEGFLAWSEPDIAVSRERLSNHLLSILTKQDSGEGRIEQTRNASPKKTLSSPYIIEDRVKALGPRYNQKPVYLLRLLSSFTRTKKI